MIRRIVMILTVFRLANSIPIQHGGGGHVVFVNDDKPKNDGENIITPPILPVIDHLENDPSTLTEEDVQKRARKIEDSSDDDGFNTFGKSSYRDQKLPGISISLNDQLPNFSKLQSSTTSTESLPLFFAEKLPQGLPDPQSSITNFKQSVSGFVPSISVEPATLDEWSFKDNKPIRNLDFGLAPRIDEFQEARLSNNFPSGIATSFDRSFGFNGDQPKNIAKEDVIYVNLNSGNSGATVKFPGRTETRFSNVQHHTVPFYSQTKRKNDIYDIIRIEI